MEPNLVTPVGLSGQDISESLHTFNVLRAERVAPIRPPRDRSAELKQAMKRRHLDKGERENYHRPGNDWRATKRGDACYSAVTLQVDDLLSKHKVSM